MQFGSNPIGGLSQDVPPIFYLFMLSLRTELEAIKSSCDT